MKLTKKGNLKGVLGRNVINRVWNGVDKRPWKQQALAIHEVEEQ